MTSHPGGEILTLEPLIEAIRIGVERDGWALSGLQKTTSHQFEGRWDGESTRSAYVFFHPVDGPDDVSVDVYLDETSRGLTGNLALVVDLARLEDIGNVREVLALLGAVSAAQIRPRHQRPLTLRLRLADASDPPGDAETEVRFKVRIPRAVIGEGGVAVAELASEVVTSFRGILGSDALMGLILDVDAPETPGD